jgi:hypothetical protein
MPTKISGKPSTVPYTFAGASSDPDDIGGLVATYVAGGTLNYGDLVFTNPGGRVIKDLDASWYHARFVGAVVGGTATQQEASSDPALIGKAMSVAGENVIIQNQGTCYVANDATGGFSYYGQAVISGQTTAGRALALDKNLGSFLTSDAAVQISAGGSALGKIAKAGQVIISGALGTAITAANTAALSGTVNNGNFGIFCLRSTGGANETTAHGTDAATLAGVALPAAPSVGTATYGFILVHPTGTGNFVGGTTALDDATVVPNAVFASLYAYYWCLGWAIDTGGAAGVASRMRLAL